MNDVAVEVESAQGSSDSDEPPSRVSGPPRVISEDRRTHDDTPVELSDLCVLMGRVLSLEGAPVRAEASLILVEESLIAEMKAEHLDGDGAPTDVLSFPIDGVDPSADLIGDVVLCPSVAAAQAAGHSGSLEDELALLVVHAALHLSGWDHEDDEDRVAMWQRERELLGSLFRLPPRDPWSST